jgi:hypothetical protein
VIPWETYTSNDEVTARADGQAVATDPERVNDFSQAIDPDWVGPMVLNAILENNPYVITHPTPESVARHAEELVQSYRPGNLLRSNA